MLEVAGLAKTYPGGDQVLCGVSLTVKATEVVFVIGPSGAGKSTLIRCINRLVEPDAGSVRLDGVEITRLTGADLRRARRHMAMIFQEFNLVERLTVMENVLSGRLGYVGLWRAWRRRFPAEDVELAFETLARVGLAGFENKRADELSGGPRPRGGGARALARQFAQRILGLNQGVFVFEGTPEDLTPAVLDLIYAGAGEELTSALGGR